MVQGVLKIHGLVKKDHGIYECVVSGHRKELFFVSKMFFLSKNVSRYFPLIMSLAAKVCPCSKNRIFFLKAS